jgi:hypothetical protein
MTTINGAKHDVEDILASIRTSIAERAPSFETERRLAALRGRNAIAEEAGDFELPAIFKAPAQPISDKPNLFGRLSEALASGGPQERDRSRTVIPFEPLHARTPEPPPVARVPAPEPSADMADKIAAENNTQKRTMATFFDQRMNRMSAMSQPVAPQPAPQAPPVAAQPAMPPRLPDQPRYGDEHQPANVEDAAAQLLRPILRQWLSENMPKIVERALLTETGPAQPPTPPTGRVGPVRG